MEARILFLDVEADQPAGSTSGPDPPVCRRWLLMGTVAACLLMAMVVVGFGGAGGVKLTAVLTKAFAPSAFAAPGLRPMIGQKHKFAQRQAAGHTPTRPTVQRPAVARLAPVRMAVKDNEGTRADDHLMMYLAYMDEEELNMLMRVRGVSTEGCSDKEQLLARAEKNRDLLGGPDPGSSGKGAPDPVESGMADQNPEVVVEAEQDEEKSDAETVEHLDFASMRAGALKKLLTERGVSKKSIDSCFEKEELLKLAEQNRELLEGSSSPGVTADTPENAPDVAAVSPKNAPDTAAESPEDAPADLDALKDLLTGKGVPWSVETETPSPVGADPAENPPVKAEVVDIEVMDVEVVEKADADTDTKSKTEVKGVIVEFAKMKAGALKKLLEERGVSTKGCFDRDQLLERVRENRQFLEGRSAASNSEAVDVDAGDSAAPNAGARPGSPPGAGTALGDQEPAEAKGQWSNDDGWDPVARSEKFAKDKTKNDSKVNLGEAVDTLNRDIPQILRSDTDSRRVRPMNWDIYTEGLETKFIGLDPAIMAQFNTVSPGFSPDLRGLSENKQALQQLQAVLPNAIESDVVTVTTKMSLDPNSGGEVIESKWRAKLTTKNLAAPEMLSQLFGLTGPLILPESVIDVSAVSRFHVNAAGRIYLHTIDQLDVLIDNKPIDVPQLDYVQNLLGGLSGGPQNGGPQYGGPQYGGPRPAY